MSHNPHKKTINGHVCLSIRLPHTFEVDAHDETYIDRKGCQYDQEEYEYGVDNVLQYSPNKHAEEINRDIQYLKDRGWTIEEIKIEEC